MKNLITEYLDIWTTSQTQKSNVGRGSGNGSNGQSAYGIKKLRELILELAVRGKLVPQDPNDEPANILLEKTSKEKAKLIKEGKIKKQKPSAALNDNETPFNLPKGWSWTRLIDICLLENGDRSKNYPNKSALVDKGIPFINAGHLKNNRIDITDMNYISKDRYEILKSGKIQKGDILYCLRGSLGKIAIVDNIAIGAVASSLVIVRLFRNIMNMYIVDYFNSQFATNIMRKYDNGTAQPNLAATALGKFIIPIPPLNEQHRIVAKVDELMALCDQFVKQESENTETHQSLVKTLLSTLTSAADHKEFSETWNLIKEHFDILFTTEESIDQLKQTILQLAVIGKLVEQNPEDEPASELLKKIAKEKEKLIKEGKIKKQNPLPAISEDEKPFEIPEGWKWVSFYHIAENANNALKAGPFGSALKKSMYVNKGYKIYGQEQVISGDENYGDYYITLNKYDSLESCAVKSGDILLSLVGTIGKVLVLSENCMPGIINPRLVKISLFKDISRIFIKLVLASPLIQEELNSKSHGGTMNILNLGLIKDLIFPFPPIAEQHRIVSKVDELMALCDTLKSGLNSLQDTQIKLADVITEKVAA